MSESYENGGDQQPGLTVPRPPFPVITCLLIAGIAAVFLSQVVTGLPGSSDIVEAFYKSGRFTAFDKAAFLEKHEYWRILTGATVHGGLLHFFMNAYALYSFGKIFELISFRLHLATVFLLAAIGGGLLSLIFVPYGSSVGASGGICGVVSYLAVYAFRRRQFISHEFRKALLINIGFILLFGLALYQYIDNFGHIGGLIVGAVYGLIQIPSDEYVDPRQGGSAAAALGYASLAVYLAVCAFSILLMLRVV